MNKKTILFVSYGGGHIHMVKPVAKYISKFEFFNVLILALPSALPNINSSDFEVITFRDLLEKNELDAIRWGTKIAENHHNTDSKIDLKESIAYLGLSFKDLVDKIGLEKAKRKFKSLKRHAFHQTTIVRRAILIYKPDFIVTTNSPRAESASIEEGILLNIPTLSMSDLFLGMNNYVLKANHLTYLNEYAFKVNMQAGLVNPQKSEIHLVGNPAFDDLLIKNYKKDSLFKSQLSKQLLYKKSILHIHSHSWVDPKNGSTYQSKESLNEELSIIYNSCKANKVNLLIRPHPSENINIFKKFVKNNPGSYLAYKYSLKELLNFAEIIIVRSSTVAIEALYLRKKVIQIDPHLHTDLPITDLNLATGVPLCSKLTKTIFELLENNSSLFFKNIELFLPQEAAAPKVSNIILQNLKI